MILDQLNVFFDEVKATSGMTSKALSFTPYAGRNCPVYIALFAKGKTAGDFTVEVQQSSDNKEFSTVETVSIKKTDTSPLLNTFQVPLGVKEPYVRLKVAGTVEGLTLFAGLSRDQMLPYDTGLYRNKGQVVA